MGEKISRQQAIEQLLRQELITDQAQLVKLLHTRYSIETNQTVVSRDLHKLGVAKKRVKGELVYELPEGDILSEILKLAIIDIVHNESTIVIITQQALAAFVGDAIDALEDIDILGCIAGENTLFVTPKSVKQIEKTYLQLCQKLGFKKRKS
ncbi:MAG: hypothetical protein LLF94_07465 [Chlamydiales bacterium]|nr:hypothetical protein [Chlamydiales bacterium]